MIDLIAATLKFGRFALGGITKVTGTTPRIIISFDQNDRATGQLYAEMRERGNNRHTNGQTDRVWRTEDYDHLTIEVQKPRKPFTVRSGKR